jgi:hypothetical protein
MKWLIIIILFVSSLQGYGANSKVIEKVKHSAKNNPTPKKKTYEVKAKDSWTSIGRKYGISVAALKEANKKITALHPGDILVIPVAIKGKPTPATKPTTPKAANVPFIKINTVSPTKTEEPETKPTTTAPETKPAEIPAHVNKPVSSANDSATKPQARKELHEQGIASWIEDADINPNKYFALHRTAPVGTVIKVTNKMNNKMIFVKVVGSLPATGDNENLIIKISKASAEKLGVRDRKFQCELSYVAG